jgi:hypothetical protein
MATWGKPHISKIYEAITAIADGRIEVDGNHAKCYSSSKGKFYEIDYDPETQSIMSNDNTAFFTGHMSYPMVAMLMLKSVVTYDPKMEEMLKGIVWKDIVTKYKHDYDKAVESVLEDLNQKGEDAAWLKSEAEKIHEKVCSMEFKLLGKRRFPPKGY